MARFPDDEEPKCVLHLECNTPEAEFLLAIYTILHAPTMDWSCCRSIQALPELLLHLALLLEEAMELYDYQPFWGEEGLRRIAAFCQAMTTPPPAKMTRRDMWYDLVSRLLPGEDERSKRLRTIVCHHEPQLPPNIVTEAQMLQYLQQVVDGEAHIRYCGPKCREALRQALERREDSK